MNTGGGGWAGIYGLVTVWYQNEATLNVYPWMVFVVGPVAVAVAIYVIRLIWEQFR